MTFWNGEATDPMPRPLDAGTSQPVAPARPRVLSLDADLGSRLRGPDHALAKAAARCRVESVGPGEWAPNEAARRGQAAMLVIDGLFVRDVSIGDARAVELVGAGDIVLALPEKGTDGFLEIGVRWTALQPTRVAWLGRSFAEAGARWPGLWIAVFERMERRARETTLIKAISDLRRVDERLLALLWLLSERWGRVTSQGVTVELRLTHRVLGDLVGAQRPTVTSALGELQEREAVSRRHDGGWLLHGPPPTTAHPPAAPDRPRRATVQQS